jgi:hypothetical protein
MSDLPSRRIIHEHEFEEQLSRLIFDPELADEFIAAAEEMLARDPENGMPCEPTGTIWYVPMSLVRGRRVSLYYTFDDETVNLLWIQAFDD